ncbi:hypothetical protein [Azospirillum palustre]
MLRRWAGMIHSAVIDHGRCHGGVLRFENSCLRQGFFL